MPGDFVIVILLPELVAALARSIETTRPHVPEVADAATAKSDSLATAIVFVKQVTVITD